MMAYYSSGGLSLFVVFILIQAGNGKECTQIKQVGHYSCEGMNLTYIPTSIPSSIETLDFSFNFLPELHRSIFPQLQDLRFLDLTRCHIHQIAADAFHNVQNVTTLILTGNSISYIGLNGLNSLQNLHRLVLTDTSLASLNIEFNNLINLQELSVGSNNILSMDLPPFMKNFKDLQLLDLHANNISTIKVYNTNILREMRKNMTLILSRNPIIYIEPGAFQNIHLGELYIRSAFISMDAQRDGLKALSGLSVGKLIIGTYLLDDVPKTSDDYYLDSFCSVDYRELDSLQVTWPASDLHCTVNATKITLEKSNMRTMKMVPFQQVKELSLLNNLSPMSLELSHLHSLESLVVVGNNYLFFYGLTDMPKLQYVNLSRNKIVLNNCCSNYFRGMPNIRSLNLSVNSVVQMNQQPFDGLSSVEVLDFHLTHLSGISVQFELFKDLPHLQFLDISYSDMIFRSTMTFGSTNNLKVLKMAGSSIQGDALNFLFENLTNVEILDISNCNIKNISWRTFKDLSKLQHLFLNQNRLTVLDFLTHPNLKSLTLLEVQTNNIDSIPLNVLYNLPINLSVFDLSFNPVDCSCSHLDFILWLTSHQQILSRSNNILCKMLFEDSKMRAIDFDTESCVHIRTLAIVVPTCAVVLLFLAAVLSYKFQFYLRYGFILLRGYRASRQQEFSYDAFVIYSSKDDGWVMDELVENLENGFPPIHLCLHVRDFEAGKAITANIIDEGILGSRKIIVVVSKHFIESSWCQFEFEVAQSWLVMQGNSNIIIIILENVEEEKTQKIFGLHKHLKNNTYLKWSENPMSTMIFWVRLRKAVMKRN